MVAPGQDAHGRGGRADWLLGQSGRRQHRGRAPRSRGRDDDWPGPARFGDSTWTWRRRRGRAAARGPRLASALRVPGPFHIGVLLDNVPEYLLWLGGAALAGATVVGINPTSGGGDELARDIRFTDCQLVVTDRAGVGLLDGLDHRGRPRNASWRGQLRRGGILERIITIDGQCSAPRQLPGRDDRRIRADATCAPWRPRTPPPALLFTSGTTGDPKAVRCTQGRLAAIAGRAGEAYGFERDDICYCPMPLFHGNAIMALWAPALAVGASVAVAGRFSASRFLAEVRHVGATRFTYVGKALAYVLGTPEHDDDADNPLRQGFGTEASGPDRADFERRFACRLVEGYGSSEGGTSINVTPDSPRGHSACPRPPTTWRWSTPSPGARVRTGPLRSSKPAADSATPGTQSARS